MKPQLNLKFLLLIVFMSGYTGTTHAHGGGLDANGCHTNRKTGEYHCHRNNAPNSTNTFNQQQSTTQEISCRGKTRCGQMLSCAEARYYMNNCGLGRLDGDGDGIPCETLCGN